MHECRCHGILVDGVYGSIDHNQMYSNSAGPIRAAGGNGFGPGPQNLAIRSNQFRHAGQETSYLGALTFLAQNADGSFSSEPIFQKILIEDNEIEAVPGPAIQPVSMRYFTIAHNVIMNSDQDPSPISLFPDLPETDSILIYQSSHGTVCGNELLGRTTGPIGTDPTDGDVQVNSSCGFSAHSIE
jgi:hypothetical protein